MNPLENQKSLELNTNLNIGASHSALVDFLSADLHSETDAHLASLLKRVVRSFSTPQEKAVALSKMIDLDLSGDPYFPTRKSIDTRTLAQFLPNLQSLKLSHQPLESSEGLGSFKNLKSLELANCGLVSLDFLHSLDQIERLDLSKNPDISSQLAVALEAKISLPLRRLFLNDLMIRSADFMVNFGSLETLSLAGNNLNSLKEIAEFKSITSLNFDSNMIDDLTFLSKWRNLKKLSFKNNAISDLSPLQDLYGLTDLFFNANKVRSLKPLKGLRDLLRVGCNGNALYDDDYDCIPRSVRVD
jgi:Leucine-rich repeat (LRR) protein